jgi:hypothetical protein
MAVKVSIVPKRVHRGVALLWVFLLILVASTFFVKLDYFAHLYWHGLTCAISLLLIAILRWLLLSKSSPVAKSKSGRILPCSNKPNLIYVALSPSKAKLGHWGYIIQFSIASLFPAMVNWDMAIMFFNTLAFSIQNHLANGPLLIAALAALLTIPLGINAFPIWSTLNSRSLNSSIIVIALPVFKIGIELASIFPATQDSPAKVKLGISGKGLGSVAKDMMQSGGQFEIPVHFDLKQIQISHKVRSDAPRLPNFISRGESESKEFPDFFDKAPRVFGKVSQSNLEIDMEVPPQVWVSCFGSGNTTMSVVLHDAKGVSTRQDNLSSVMVGLVSPNSNVEVRHQLPLASLNAPQSVSCMLSTNDAPFVKKVYQSALSQKPSSGVLGTDTIASMGTYTLQIDIGGRQR